jgi:hypothetical protein
MFLQRVVLVVVVVVVVVSRGFFTYRFTRFFSSSFSLFSSSSSWWWWCSLFFLVPVVVVFLSSALLVFFFFFFFFFFSRFHRIGMHLYFKQRSARVSSSSRSYGLRMFGFVGVSLARFFVRAILLSVFKSCEEEKGETFFVRERASGRSIIRLIVYVFDSYSI